MNLLNFENENKCQKEKPEKAKQKKTKNAW